MPSEQFNDIRTRAGPEIQTKRQGSISPRVENSGCFGLVKVDPDVPKHRVHDRKGHAVLHLISQETGEAIIPICETPLHDELSTLLICPTLLVLTHSFHFFASLPVFLDSIE
jgi:hypothetical protein